MKISKIKHFFIFLVCFNTFSEGSKKINIFEFPNFPLDMKTDELKNADGSYTLKVPIKQTDGTYRYYDVTYLESVGKSTVDIPGLGDFSIIKDNSGNYNFEITPEQINNSENIKCSITTTGKGQCSIEPFVSIIRNKVLTSDKLTIDYTEGESLVVAGGRATNLKLVEKDKETSFSKSETIAGDSTIEVTFEKVEKNESKPPIIIGGQVVPSFGLVPAIPVAVDYEDQRYLKINLSTSALTQTVVNPDNREQSAVKFKVKDGGANLSLEIDKRQSTKINFNGSTSSGIYYNSNPFSEKSLIVNTTSAMNLSYKADNNPINPHAQMSLTIGDLDNNGVKSITEVVDNRTHESKRVKSIGATYVTLTQETAVDEKSLLPLNRSAPLFFEVGSEYIEYGKSKNGTEESLAIIRGLHASGDIDKKAGTTFFTATGSEATIRRSENGVKEFDIKARNINYILKEDDDSKKQEALTSYAYYNNGEKSLELSDGSYFQKEDYKNKNMFFNGKPVARESTLVGNTIEFKDKKNIVNINGGVVAKEIKYFDGSSSLTFGGENITIENEKYNFISKGGFTALIEKDSKGNESFVQISSSQIEGSSKNDKLSILNSSTSKEIIGDKNSGRDVFQIKHHSDSISYSKNNGEEVVSAQKLAINHVNSDKIKYGSVRFDTLGYSANMSKKPKNLEISSVEAIFYIDETDKNNQKRNLELNAKQLEIIESDFKVNVKSQDKEGNESTFKIYIYEDKDDKRYKVFAEDGSQVNLNGVDKNDKKYSLIFSAIDYIKTPEFTNILVNNLNGSLEDVFDGDKRVLHFDAVRIEASEDLLTETKQLLIDQAFLGYSDSKTQFNGNVSGAGISSKTYEYAEVDLSNLSIKGKGVDKDLSVNLDSLNLLYSSNKEGSLKNSVVEVSSSKLMAANKDFVINLVGIDKNKNEEKFKILHSDSGGIKRTVIIGENGNQIFLDAKDKKNKFTTILLDAVEYIESDEFKNVDLQKGQVSFKEIGASDNRMSQFSFDRFQYQDFSNSKVQAAQVSNLNLVSTSAENNSTFRASNAQYTSSTFIDSKEIKAGIFDGVINYVEFGKSTKGKQPDVKMSADVNFKNIFLNEVKTNEDKITYISANGVDFVAVDEANFLKVSGEIGQVNRGTSNNMSMLQLKDIRKIDVQDLSSDVVSLLSANEILRVETKDRDGKVVSSYLLINSAILNARDNKNGISTDLKIGVLEMLQDKANGKNILLKADVNGKLTLDKTKSAVRGEVSFALKGEGLTTDSHSYVSDDGNTVKNYFAIIPTGEASHLDNLKLSVGPSFLKDAISLEAKGSKSGGKNLSFNFEQDKKNGTYYIRAEFKDGDKVKVKLFPFKLESKIEGGDAVAELLLTPKGQNYLNHMQIISSVINTKEITEWLEVSEGGMLVARTGTLGGFGFEMMYQNQKSFDPNPGNNIYSVGDSAASYGAGIFHNNSKGDKASVGILLSGDSEFEYKTNGAGVLQIFGHKMDKTGRIPATINLYMRKDYKDGDSLYAGVSVDTASYAVDETRLSKSAQFYDNGRSLGKAGVSIGYSKRISPSSTISLVAGANENFSNPAFCLTYTKNFGVITETTANTMRVLNKFPRDMERQKPKMNLDGPTIKEAMEIVKQEISEIEYSFEISKLLEKISYGLETYLESDSEISISSEDISALVKYEKEQYKSHELSKYLKRIKKSSETATDLDAREKLIRETMASLTKIFTNNPSAQIFEEYKDKVDELNRLMQQ